MPLLAFPNELLLLVVGNLDRPRDLYALILTNHRLADLVTPFLHTLALEDKDLKTALQWAAKKGYEPLVSLLLDKGVDIDFATDIHKNFFKATPAFIHAAKNRHFSILKLLHARGANIDSYHHASALDYAAKNNDEEMVRFLLSKGALISEDCHHITALHKAAKWGNAAIVKLLVEHKGIHTWINHQSPSHCGGHTALHYAVRYQGGTEDRVEVLRILLEKGADASIKDTHGKTAFDYALVLRFEGALKVLLEHDPKFPQYAGAR